jgi:hypothetical protein
MQRLGKNPELFKAKEAEAAASSILEEEKK